VESVLESNHVKNLGFSLKDAVNMVVMLDQLIFDTESSLLEKIYQEHYNSHPDRHNLHICWYGLEI